MPSMASTETGAERDRAVRVLHVSPRFTPYIGGVEQHVAEVAPRLAAMGMSVTVLTTDVSRALPTTAEYRGVAIRRVPAYPASRDYYFAPAIAPVIRLGGPWDIVHVQGYQSLVSPLAMLSALRADIPYVLTLHSGGHSSPTRKAIRGAQLLALRPLVRGARQIIAVSTFEATAFARRLRLRDSRFTVIPNGGEMPTGPGHAEAAAHQPLIVSVGRLERYKGHQRILAAMPRIAREWPSARLRIVGEGAYEAELRGLATRLGVSGITEIAPIPSDDRVGMARLLGQASLVTLLSDYESQGIVVMEALAFRRPVLVTYTSGLMEYADRGLARAVPLDATTDVVAAAVLEQLRRPLQFPAFEIPSWDDCARSVADVYRSIVHGTGSPQL